MIVLYFQMYGIQRATVKATASVRARARESERERQRVRARGRGRERAREVGREREKQRWQSDELGKTAMLRACVGEVDEDYYRGG